MPSSSNSNDVAHALDCLHFLLGLIESRDWDSLHDITLSHPSTFRTISNAVPHLAEFNGMTLLHAIVRYDPPVEVLARMIELHPRALQSEDCLGRTPLHVAAGSGACPSTLRLLASNYPRACDVRDEDGRTPLHLACDASCELFEDECPPRDPPSLETVEVLLSGSLRAATVEDADEMNPVEYALLSGASMRVVQLLQRASQRVMRRATETDGKMVRKDVHARSPQRMGVVRPRLSTAANNLLTAHAVFVGYAE